MRRYLLCNVALSSVGLIGLIASHGGAEPANGKVSAAYASIDRAIVPLAKSIEVYPTKVSCFSCHHQGAPGLALRLALKAGHATAREPLQKALAHTRDDLKRDIKLYTDGDGQPGGISRAGYAMLALSANEEPKSAVTDAVAAYVLRRDPDQPYWKARSNRPPSEHSSFTDTALSIRTLKLYGDATKTTQIAGRIEKAMAWLQATPVTEHEDRVFKLMGLYEAGGRGTTLSSAADDLLKTQGKDGGWAQLDGAGEDVYATATAVYALLSSGVAKPGDRALMRAELYLLKAQLPDGTWHVTTRAKPVQPYFESGFPHVKDQFISITATAWAIAALSFYN